MLVTLFDREKEQETIAAFCHRLVAGEPSCRVLWLDGPPGVGKSRLLKHACDQLPFLLFRDGTGNAIHRCSSANKAQSLAYPTELLTQFFATDASQADKLLFSVIERDFSSTSIIEGLAMVLPGVVTLPGVKEILNRPLEKTRKVRDLLDEPLVRLRLRTVYTTVLYHYLKPRFKDQRLFLAIDDLHWLDRDSRDVICSLANRLREDGLFLGLLVASRDYYSTEPTEDYAQIEESLVRLDLHLEKIHVGPMEPYLAEEFVQTYKGHLPAKIIRRIAESTGGNFYELTQLIRFSDHEITQRLERTSAATPSAPPVPLAEDLLARRLEGDRNELLVLGILALLQSEVEIVWVQHLLARIPLGHRPPTIPDGRDFQETLSALETAHLVRRCAESITLEQSRTIDPVLHLLLAQSLYRPIAETLVAETMHDCQEKRLYFRPALVARAIAIGLQINGLESEDFGEICHSLLVSHRRSLPILTSLLDWAAKLADPTPSARPAIVTLFVSAVQAGLYAAIDPLGQRLFPLRDHLSTADAFHFLYHYAIALREAGYYQRADAPDAGQVATELVDRSLTAAVFERNLARLLLGSILEHYREHGKIRTLYQSIAADLSTMENPEERIEIQTRFLRNQGLVRDHEVLEDTYREALSVCGDSVGKGYSRQVLEATVHNNLGLSYARRGILQPAIEQFEIAFKLLRDFELEHQSPLNNLAVCLGLQKNYATAHELLLRAKSLPRVGPYRAMSIEMNLAIVEWFLGQRDTAMQRVLGFIEGNSDGAIVFDRELSERSRMTYGFFLMSQGKFAEAASQFKRSLDVNYRLAVDQERFRREFMTKFCLIKAGLNLGGDDLGSADHIDLEDRGTIPTHKPYDYQFLALYML